MINPLNFVAEILQTHDSCLLPGLGVIQRKKQASHYDIRLGEFCPPDDLFIFTETTDQQTESGVYSIIDYMAAGSHIMPSIAQTQWEVFKNDLYTKLLSGVSMPIQGIGILCKSSNGTISLNKVTQDGTFYPLLAGISLLKDSAVLSEPETDQTAQPSEMLAEFDNIKNSDQFRSLWVWVLVILVALFAILGYLYIKEMPGPRSSRTVQSPVGPDVQVPAQNTDSESSSQATDTFSSSAEALPTSQDSTAYNFVIARYTSQQSAVRYSERMIHWGHPAVVKHRDSSYFVCIQIRLLPSDTSSEKARLAGIYGPHIFILNSPD